MAIVSLLICAGSLALWVRSYSKSDSLDRWRREVAGPGTYHDTMGVFATRGMIGGGYLRMYLPTAQDWPTEARWRFITSNPITVMWPHRWRVLGFGYWNTRLPQGPAYRALEVVGATVPLWFVALLFAVAPAMAARRQLRDRQRRRRIARGLCAACGYDVRASGERCPECGLSLVPPPSTPGEG
jgi:hypothetical protein